MSRLLKIVSVSTGVVVKEDLESLAQKSSLCLLDVTLWGNPSFIKVIKDGLESRSDEHIALALQPLVSLSKEKKIRALIWNRPWVQDGLALAINVSSELVNHFALQCLASLSECKENRVSMWRHASVKAGLERGINLPWVYLQAYASKCLLNLASEPITKAAMSSDVTLLEVLRFVLGDSGKASMRRGYALSVKQKLVGWNYRGSVNHLETIINKLQKTNQANSDDTTTPLLGSGGAFLSYGGTTDA